MYQLFGTPELTYDVIAEITDYWRTEGLAIEATTVSKGELHSLVSTMLAAYVSGVTVGDVPPLDMSDPMLWYPRNKELRAYMATRTGLESKWVDEFFYNLWDGVQAGKIDAVWLRPKEAAQGQGILRDLVEAITPEAANGNGNGNGDNGLGVGWILAIAGLGVLAFVVGKKRKRRA